MKDSPLHRDRVRVCRDRWLELCTRYGYRRGWRELHREFDPALCADVATQRRTSVVAVDHAAHGTKANPESVAAGKRYDGLFTRTRAGA